MSIEEKVPQSFDEWKTINNPLLDKHGSMSIITSANVTVGKAVINEKIEMNVHHHLQEQITVVIEGEMDIEYDGKKKTVKAGESCIIPSDVPHKIWITEVPFRSFDIFSPIKDDFIKNALDNALDKERRDV